MRPEQVRKSRSALHDLKPGACRRNCTLNLGPVADDAGILHQRFDLSLRIARDFFRRKTIEGAAKILALAQNGDPRKAGLETVEHKFFIESAIVELGYAPFFVVIGDVERILF